MPTLQKSGRQRFDSVARILFIFAALLSLIILSSFVVLLIAHIHPPRDSEWGKTSYSLYLNALSTIAITITGIGGLFTIAAATSPSSLSVYSFGPKLRLKFDAEGSRIGNAYVVSWKRNIEGQRCNAVLIRLAVENAGVSAAESVEVWLEQIARVSGSVSENQYTKPIRLRWADSYDLTDFETLKYHRCPSVVEPFIHAGTQHFLDFAFIFDPSAVNFYRKLTEGTRGHPDTSGEYWCIHPFYQWLLAHDGLKILEPDHIANKDTYYDVRLLLSCNNGVPVQETIQIRCGPQSSLIPGSLSVESIGSLNSESPIGIDLKPR